MKQNKNRKLVVLLSAILLLALGGVSLAVASGGNQSSGHPLSRRQKCSYRGGETVEISTAKLIIEFNATDEDMGVHGAFDDSGWSELCVFDPNGRLILNVQPQSQLKDLTMAGIFFESREPELDEFSYEDLQANFPEGEYTVQAKSYDGTILTGTAVFSHEVPEQPTITYPPLADEAEVADEAVVPTADLVIEWEAVTQTISGDAVAITGYEVIITQEEFEDPNGFSRPIFDVHVGPEQTSLSVPAEFLQPDTIYELEVLALEESGNQTITVGFFTTGAD